MILPMTGAILLILSFITAVRVVFVRYSSPHLTPHLQMIV
jgi:hypothetical protein